MLTYFLLFVLSCIYRRLSGPSSKKYPGTPFIPVAAQAVDMFPHTAHCELIMMLERKPEAEAAEAAAPAAAAAEKKDE